MTTINTTSTLDKVEATGRAYTQDIGQLANQGIPIWQKLAEKLGVTTDEVRTMATQGKIDFQTFSDAAADADGTVAAEYNFDAWTEEAETAAVKALVPKVQHIIVENRFIGRFADGVIVELPLRLTLDDVNELANKASDPVDQVKELLTGLGGAETAAEFTRHNLAETTGLASRYFTILNKISAATLPE